jgi:hypothetical protein
MPNTPNPRILEGVRVRAPHRFLTACVLAGLVAFPAVAGAKQAPARDGSLAIRDGKGTIQIMAKGTILGQLQRGQIRVVDQNPFDSIRPHVTGFDWKLRRSRTTIVYGGRDLRYRLAGAFFRVKLTGLGVDLSAVGRGTVILQGDLRYADTGLYSLNASDFTPVPYEKTTLKLVAKAPANG